jgi:hypothetical protein
MNEQDYINRKSSTGGGRMSRQCIVCGNPTTQSCPVLLGLLGAISPMHTTFTKCNKPLCMACIHGCDGKGDRPAPSIIPHSDDCDFFKLMGTMAWDNKYCTCGYKAQEAGERR